MILPIIFIYFSLFIVAHSNPEENVEKFNDFIKIHFGVKPSSSHSNSHAQVQHLSYEELSKFLFQVEEKVANGVLQEGQPRIDGIYEEFKNAITTKESSLLGNLLPNRHEKEKHAQLKSHLAVSNEDKQGKVQFLMLLLSFATRVAFTMGSEALKKTRKIQMNSFLRAYEKLEKEFPAENQENHGYDANYRHYYGANLYPNDKENRMGFELLTIHSTTNEGRRTSYMTCQPSNQLLEQIEQYSPDHENLDIFFTNFIKFWTQGNYPGHEYNKVKIFALKRFGMNLANRILRQHNSDNSAARAYFRSYENAKNKLLSLLKKLKDAVKELGPIDNEAELKFVNENEMYMHYEDAIEFDWKKDINISLDVKSFWSKCTTSLSLCISDPTNIDANKAKIEEIKNAFLNKNKATFESFMLNTAPFEHAINQVLASMAVKQSGKPLKTNLSLKMTNLAHEIADLSTKCNDAIQEEFDGLLESLRSDDEMTDDDEE